MLTLNSNWSKWFKASVYYTLITRLQADLGTNFLVVAEGNTEVDTRSNQAWVEMRVDGPDFKGLPTLEILAECEINVLISAIINEETAYRIDEIKGVVQKALSTPIDVKKYGDGEADVACLRLGEIITRDFGQVEPHTPLHQSTVEVPAEAYLT